MSKKVVDLQAVRKASENLDRLAAEHPELLGESTAEEWEAVLKGRLAKPGRERQKALRDRRAALGVQRFEVWVDPERAEALRQRYPAERGGVDWARVIDQALGAKASPVTKPAQPREPVRYWKPDPNGPMVDQCQAQTARGDRCKLRNEVIVKAKDDQGRLAEFGSCRRHATHEFKPHGSVMP